MPLSTAAADATARVAMVFEKGCGRAIRKSSLSPCLLFVKTERLDAACASSIGHAAVTSDVGVLHAEAWSFATRTWSVLELDRRDDIRVEVGDPRRRQPAEASSAPAPVLVVMIAGHAPTEAAKRSVSAAKGLR